MFDREKFRQVARDSGLSKRELATVFGVSHMTIYGWLEEREPGQEHVRRFVASATEALLAAIKRGVLPISRALPRDRRANLVKIMAETVQKKQQG